MSSKTLNEPVLEDDYPVYAGYCYVADGRVVQSLLQVTVRDLKRDTGAKEIRRCDLAGRDLL